LPRELTRLLGFAAVGTFALLTALAVPVASSGAALLPPQNPGANFGPNLEYNGPCAPTEVSASCPEGLGTIDALRAEEGVVPMSLPTDFGSLTDQEQVFVVANLERVDRGLAPIAGMAGSLDANAQAAASSLTDPALPAYGGLRGSNWGESNNLFTTDNLFMYQDGWQGAGTTNLACTSPSAAGCWAHRDNILASYASPTLMGSGVTTTGNSLTSVAQLFVGSDTQDAPSFTWSQVTPFLPAGVGSSTVGISAPAGGVGGGSLEIYASGTSMNVSLSLTSGNGVFSLNTPSCSLPAGHACAASISFTPPALGQYSGTLLVNGPTGSTSVALHGVASRGYRLASADGGVFTFGNAGFDGSLGGTHLSAPIVGLAATPDGGGYYMVASNGGVFTFGDAHFYGSGAGLALGSPVVGMAVTPDGRGYWLTTANGGVFTFGDASFHGAGLGVINASVVGIAPTSDGGGYWLATTNGGIFTFGDARFLGSAGAMPLNAPIVGLTATPDGGGYWLVASDGGIFTFGNASFFGSTGGMALNAPIVGMTSTPDGGGYWLVAADGGVFNYGDAGFYGSTGGMRLGAPVVGLAVGQNP
jgi:hypothetical protein